MAGAMFLAVSQQKMNAGGVRRQGKYVRCADGTTSPPQDLPDRAPCVFRSQKTLEAKAFLRTASSGRLQKVQGPFRYSLFECTESNLTGPKSRLRWPT